MADKQQEARNEGESAAHGVGAVIDPTKNVLDLVRAESKYQDGMRDALEKMQTFARDANDRFQNYARDAESKLQSWMRDAESKRIDQIRAQGERFETVISNMLSKSVESTQSLVATQLLQIQNTFNERVARLEQWRYERTGSASVSDPALAASLSGLASNLSAMQTTFADAITKSGKTQADTMAVMAASIAALQTTGVKTEGRTTGQGQIVGWIVAGILLIAAVASPIITIILSRH